MPLRCQRNDMFNSLNVSIAQKRGVKQHDSFNLIETPAVKLKMGNFDLKILDGIFFTQID